MYALGPAVRDLWAALFARVSQVSGVRLDHLEHAAPAPLDELWHRPDLGLAFACGYPFATDRFPLRPVAAPVPAGRRYGGRPVYATDLVARADGPLHGLEDSFGGRIGWTVEHSQSGFNAVRAHLAAIGAPRYREAVGPLVTPRRVIEAVLDGRIDVGPLDSYVHDLLTRHEPDVAARLRTLATTPLTPMPLLVASAGVADGIVDRLREALVGIAEDGPARTLLEPLGLSGFAPVSAGDYATLLDAARGADAAGWATLA
ncbi:phosphate/phosphite/phosphonate ABC transporter substrate-binding protein [Salinarimonas soli]|uniref:Phosphate/phosphite/phosphonate ABC transporter substrate-binding protein n=2 Tax=Salinarimonas soli TaxID=1638099 RepID=A0A5B2VDL0_9HYPH|nr:phosphate/phosphite/phosphonate ABC transporter substrate-binding protein [Salinarimonas soli]